MVQKLVPEPFIKNQNYLIEYYQNYLLSNTYTVIICCPVCEDISFEI